MRQKERQIWVVVVVAAGTRTF